MFSSGKILGPDRDPVNDAPPDDRPLNRRAAPRSKPPPPVVPLKTSNRIEGTACWWRRLVARSCSTPDRPVVGRRELFAVVLVLTTKALIQSRPRWG